MRWREPGGWVVTRQTPEGREAMYCPASPGHEAQWRGWWDGLPCPPEVCRATSKKEAERWAKAFDFKTRVDYVKPMFGDEGGR